VVSGGQDILDDCDLLVYDFVGFVANELNVSLETFGRFAASQ